MPTFTPDHNGECLHCDEWLDAHGPDGACPTRPEPALACVTCGATLAAAGLLVRCRACRAVVMCEACIPALVELDGVRHPVCAACLLATYRETHVEGEA